MLGTRRRKELGTAELGGTRARVWGGVARWGLGSQRRGALYKAAQAILGRRAPDGRPAGNLGWTGAGWLLCGGEETGERARLVSESSGGDAGECGVRERAVRAPLGLGGLLG